jgi:hypothetical protein
MRIIERYIYVAGQSVKAALASVTLCCMWMPHLEAPSQAQPTVDAQPNRVASFRQWHHHNPWDKLVNPKFMPDVAVDLHDSQLHIS